MKSNPFFAVSAKCGFGFVKAVDIFIGSAASHDDVPDPIIAIKISLWSFLWDELLSGSVHQGAVCVHKNQLSLFVFELFPSSFVQFHLPPASCLFTASEF